MPVNNTRQIKLPYTPRYPDIHKALETHRHNCLVWHRRSGKSVTCCLHLIKSAMMSESPFALYAYIAPYKVMARSIIWQYMLYYTGVIPGRKISESRLSIKLPSRNGMAEVRVFGGDQPDTLRGLGLSGCVLDEFEDIKPSLMTDVVRPALSDHRGWDVIVGTPKGAGNYHAVYLDYKEKMEAGELDYFVNVKTVNDTTALSEDEVQQLRSLMGEKAFQREMMVDFTVAAEEQLISLQSVFVSQSRRLDKRMYEGAPLVIGVDVARFGDDKTCICIRQGVYCEPLIQIQGESTMDIASRLVRLHQERKPDAVFIESVGVGAGVVDRLRELQVPVIAVEPGGRAIDADHHFNLRAEMWCKMRDWIEGEGILPPDEELATQLGCPNYEYAPSGALKLESKKDIRKRLKKSTDLADSLALTFAVPVLSKKELDILNSSYKTIAEGVEDYEPLAY